jgi:hypothetical protein
MPDAESKPLIGKTWVATLTFLVLLGGTVFAMGSWNGRLNSHINDQRIHLDSEKLREILRDELSVYATHDVRLNTLERRLDRIEERINATHTIPPGYEEKP